MVKLTVAPYGDLAFLPFQPAVPFTERLSYLTDVVEAHNGQESRTGRRTKPRQEIRYKYPANLEEMPQAYNVASGALRQKWAVPIWAEVQYVGTVSGTTVACNVGLSKFEVGKPVLVYVNNATFATGLVVGIGSASITLDTPLPRLRGAFLMPVRVAWLVGTVERPTTGFNGMASAAFEVIDPPQIETEYIGLQLSIDSSVSMSLTTLDGPTRLEAVKTQLLSILTKLQTFVEERGIRLDLSIAGFHDGGSQPYYFSNAIVDFTAARAFVSALLIASGDALLEQCADNARQFFEVDSPNNGNRNDVVIVVTDGNVSDNEAVVSSAADMIGRTGAYAAPKDLDIRVLQLLNDLPPPPELVLNWDNPQSRGGDDWSNFSALGAASGETYGSFANAYLVGTTGSGRTEQNTPVAVTNGLAYTVTGWFKEASGSTANLALRDPTAGVLSVISGPLSAPVAGVQSCGPITNIQTVDLGGGVWKWSFDIEPAGAGNIRAGGGNTVSGQTIVVFAVSVKAKISGNDYTARLEDFDNTDDDAVPNATSYGADFQTVFDAMFENYFGRYYNGLPFVSDASELNGGSVNKAFERSQDRIDFDLGVITNRTTWEATRETLDFKGSAEGLAEIKAAKQFFAKRVGKLNSFYMPTFEHNIRLLTTGLITGSVAIENDDFLNWSSAQHIGFEDLSGNWHLTEIIGAVQTTDDITTLTLSPPVSVEASQLARASFLTVNRLDTDALELSFVGNSCANYTLRMTQVPE
jgi:hypothetical protein